MFADTDLKYDQPQTEIVFDRDKVAALGLNLQKVGADLSTMLGGNFVNRFSNQGRSYKVIPQIKRTERLTVDQLKDVYVSGPERSDGSALDLCDSQEHNGAARTQAVSAAQLSDDPRCDPSRESRKARP